MPFGFGCLHLDFVDSTLGARDSNIERGIHSMTRVFPAVSNNSTQILPLVVTVEVKVALTFLPDFYVREMCPTSVDVPSLSTPTDPLPGSDPRWQTDK